METRTAHPNEDKKLLTIQEDHFNDFKSKEIAPAKLQESFVAFANSDGGEIWVGIEDEKRQGDRLCGFHKKEEVNDILHTLLELTNPAVENVEVEFIDFGNKGLVLRLSIPKSPKVHHCSNGDCFIRVNARKVKIKGDRIVQLGYSKGAFVYERQPVESVELDDIAESELLANYLTRIESSLEPSAFLKKQRLLAKKGADIFPTVACILLYDIEPQAALDTRCAIKVYRLLTSETKYRREQLDTPPKTINGDVEKQIHATIEAIQTLISDASIEVDGNLEKVKYPAKTIHEILVNAVIHRDYSLNDDIHVKFFDNRIEVISPGRLPGYITIDNIYTERFSRNPNIVRLLHNLPNPVNHDIGEGLDTARNELKKVGLVPPAIEELDNTVRITIKHKKLASLEDIIMNFFAENPGKDISNRIVRDISGEDDVNKVKKAFQKLRKLNKITSISVGKRGAFDYKYIKNTSLESDITN